MVLRHHLILVSRHHRVTGGTMYEFSVEAQLSAEAEEVWAVVTDVAGWPGWDPHEKAARLDGRLEPGTIGWSKPHGGPATRGNIAQGGPGGSGGAGRRPAGGRD